MKRILIFAATLAATVACNKDLPVQQDNQTLPQEETARHELTVKVTGHSLATRATTVTGEATVNDLQVFVFRKGMNELDAYGSARSATQLSISCTTGEKDVIAIVNAPDMKEVATKDALLAKVSELSGNSLANFEMIGSTTASVPAESGITIAVDRLAARVVIRKITRDFSSPALQGVDFTIDAIYLVNAAGDLNYGRTDAPSKWYNIAKNKNEQAALLVDTPAAAVANKESHATAHHFYAYPNLNSADDEIADTRLVVETTLDGRKYYYPINMPKMDSNKSYEISELRITRPGSDDPDKPIEIVDQDFKITVNDWTVELVNGDGNVIL